MEADTVMTATIDQPLEPEQEQLFSRLVEATRSVPRSKRDDFMLLPLSGKAVVQGNGFAGDVLASDLQVLADAGLLTISNYHTRGSGFNFFVPPEGLRYYEELKQQTDEPVAAVEQEIRR